VARLFLERRHFGDDLRRLADWIGDRQTAGAAECVPPMDVFETTVALEVVVDVPGVPADALRVTFSRDRLVIAGTKRPGTCRHNETAFHLAERSFGQFARVIRLTGAFDGGRAAARLHAGELRVLLPRIEERREREIPIPVDTV
jgi:HSP20 family protein